MPAKPRRRPPRTRPPRAGARAVRAVWGSLFAVLAAAPPFAPSAFAQDPPPAPAPELAPRPPALGELGDGSPAEPREPPATAAPVPVSLDDLPEMPAAGPAASDVAGPGVAGLLVSARLAQTWRADGGDRGPGSPPPESVALLRGDVELKQGAAVVTAPLGVLWRRPDPAGPGELVTVYLEGGVRLDEPGKTRTRPSVVLDLPAGPLELAADRTLADAPATADPLFVRAADRRAAHRDGALREARRGPPDGALRGPLAGPGVNDETFPVPPGGLPGGAFGNGRPVGSDTGVRRIRLLPRSALPPSVKSFQSADVLPPEQVTVVTGGVRLLVDGLTIPGLGGTIVAPERGEPADQISLAADNVVVWTRAAGGGGVLPGTPRLQPREFPLTVYLEGNIEVRQGRNVITAERAVYDVRADRGVLLDAELTTVLPGLGETVRVRAKELRQLAEDRFNARDAWTSTSPLGVPGYRLRSRELFLEPRYDVGLPGVGEPAFDPVTGRPTNKANWLRSYGNTLILNNPITGDVPVLYAPYIAGPAEDPNIPVRNLKVGQDAEKGVRVEATLDPFSLFGVTQPAGVEADLLTGFYSDRGVAAGVRGSYGTDDLFGLPGEGGGDGIVWGVQDDGLDRLGRFRRDIEPTKNFRYRVRARHQQLLPADLLAGRSRLIGELGFRSDINVLEAWWENDWDRGPDEDTLVYGTGSFDRYGYSNWAWEALGQVRLNDFETDTGWYPKLDLYAIGEPLLGGLVTYSAHNSAGYGDLDPAKYPDFPGVELPLNVDRTGPTQLYTDLPYVDNVRGAVLLSRHELTAPLWAGPLNITPFVLGEGAFQQEGLGGDGAVRGVLSGGVRAALPFSRLWRNVRNRTLGLNGLAHKVRLEAEYRATGTTTGLGEFAQYNPLDDDPQQQFRARIPGTILRLPAGQVAPDEIDPRIYGVRSGVGLNVTSRVWELVRDQQVLRLAARQRLQTKVGAPGFERIKDWMTLDLEASLFPNSDRDNFGETFGLLSADYAWNVGDRTRFLAGAVYDVYEDAPGRWDVGFLTQRTRRGSAYLGVRHVEALGRERTQFVSSYSYLLGPKWAGTASNYVDLGNAENSGQSVTVTRLGLDFNVSVGVRYNNARDDAGLVFQIEPRFGSDRVRGVPGAIDRGF